MKTSTCGRLALLSLPLWALCSCATPQGVADRTEDRWDRRENYADRAEDRYDRRHYSGPGDYVENRYDRAENRWDRREGVRDKARPWSY